MEIIVSNRALITDIPRTFAGEIKRRLSFKNPQWIENERAGRWNGETDRVIQCFEQADNGLCIPRGFCRQLITLCKKHQIEYSIDDRRRILPEVAYKFHKTLRGYQREAVEAVKKRDHAVVAAATGSGKTEMANALIAERRQPALIICHTRELKNQWVERIEASLGIDRADIGVIGDGKKSIGEKVTVALVQSLYKCAHEVSPHIGFLICDECHRCPSRTFNEAITAFDCRYLLGLSATPYRRDRLSKLIYWYLGDVAHEVDKDRLIENGHILAAQVIIRKTDFQTSFDPSDEYPRMLSELTQDRDRNRLICSDVAREIKHGGGTCLALSDRKMHCRSLQEGLKKFGIDAEILTGDLSTQKRKDIVTRIQAGEVQAVCATGALIGEGFDCKNLENLFITTPIKFSGRVTQYIGRILRPAIGKQPKVYDYVDTGIGVLRAAAKSRQRVYNG